MDTSRHRRKIYQTLRQMEKEIKILTGRSFFIRGIVYNLRRKCGNPGCRCAKGELHQSWVLAASEKGQKLMRMVPRGKMMQWSQLANRYRHFRGARAQLVKQFQQLLRLVDELEERRRIPPPGE